MSLWAGYPSKQWRSIDWFLCNWTSWLVRSTKYQHPYRSYLHQKWRLQYFQIDSVQCPGFQKNEDFWLTWRCFHCLSCLESRGLWSALLHTQQGWCLLEWKQWILDKTLFSYLISPKLEVWSQVTFWTWIVHMLFHPNCAIYTVFQLSFGVLEGWSQTFLLEFLLPSFTNMSFLLWVEHNIDLPHNWRVASSLWAAQEELIAGVVK